MLLPPAQDQKVLVIGGGPANATASVDLIDLREPEPAFRSVAPLSLPACI